MKAWTKKYLEWMKSHVSFDQNPLQATLPDYIHEVNHAATRILQLEDAIDGARRQAPLCAPSSKPPGAAWGRLVTAVTIVAEVGSLSRFVKPRQLMGYSGLVASEHSSGDRMRRGGITKTGNAHLRRVIVEAAWAYRHRPAVGAALWKRQATASAEVKEIAWKAQHRLHARYRALTGRGKSKQQVITAMGRELLGFLWAIGVHVARLETRQAARGLTERGRERSNGDGREAHGKENPRLTYAAGLRARPALLVRGRSRRITIMRFRPANIRVINRRDSQLGHLRYCVLSIERDEKKERSEEQMA